MKTKETREKPWRLGVSPLTIGIISICGLSANIFGYMEQQLLNTYIDHILRLEPIFIGAMVSSSATMGLIFMFVFGILSDNTRSRFGRRGPYLLFGGLVSGIAIITFGLSHLIFGRTIAAYVFCYVLDVVVIGIASNSYYAAQRVQVPDFVQQEYRGRVNSIVNVLSLVGMLLPAILTLMANAMFSIPDPTDADCFDGNPDTQCSRLLTAEGHLLLLSIGGVAIMIGGILGFIFLKGKTINDPDLPPKRSFIEEFKKTFRVSEVKENPDFFKLILANLVFMSGVSAILSYLLNIIFDLGIETFGLIVILGIALPVALVVIFLLGRLTDRVGRRALIVPTILISCVGFIMMPFLIESGMVTNTGSVENLPVILLIALAFSCIVVGMLGVNIPVNTLAQDLLPEDKRGKFNGILNITSTVSQIIGAMTVGTLATYFPVFSSQFTWVFIVVPIFFLASIPLFLTVKETLRSVVPGSQEGPGINDTPAG